jgi:hypothetical protein
MRGKTRQGERKYLRFLHHERRSHRRSGVLHLHSQYTLPGLPIDSIIQSSFQVVAEGKKKRGREHTFVRTAIEAKEFPKFIPMTVCKDGISIGACALPFGTCPLRGILRF